MRFAGEAEPAGAAEGARYRQAAWTYAGYGVLYWLGGLVLAVAGRGPRTMERGGVTWFVAGAFFVVAIPWLLARERRWFDRWLLSRRDFARVLTLLVGFRAVEVARLAHAPRPPETRTVAALGVAVPFDLAAWAFCLVTLVTAVILARAAWSRG
jgi:hypothetical protein